MRIHSQLLALTIGGFLLCAAAPAMRSLRAQQTKKDYLSDTEADKIRDAETPSERIRLFMTFADDRIQKLKYTLSHPSTFDRNRAEELNGLINSYSGCVDDAADLVELGHEKQQDIRAGIKVMKAKTQEFLTYLQELQKSGSELESYKDTLDDAIEATQDALDDATKAEKDISAPVRRKG